MRLDLALLWLLCGYFVSTWVGVIHVVIMAKVFGLQGSSGQVFRPAQSAAYKATEPYHPIYNILLFPPLAYAYFTATVPTDMWRDAFAVSAAWVLVSAVVDLVGWVLVKHPWNMTFREMYVDYQPWITLTYLAIFLSPLLAGAVYVVGH